MSANTPSPNQVQITWPNTYSEWQLVQNTTLGTGSPWLPILGSAYQTNSNSISFNTAPASGNVYYRLEKLY